MNNFKKSSLVLYVAVILLMQFTACQKYVVVQQKDTEPVLIVDAEFDVTDTEHQVTITESHSVYTDTEVFATGAEVLISENGNNASAVKLIEIAPGKYQLKDYLFKTGINYQLKVDYKGGSYLATSVLFPSVENLTLNVENLKDYSSGFTLEQIETAPVVQKVNLSFKDANPSVFNYYRIAVYIDSTKLNTEFFVTDQSLNSQGEIVHSFILNNAHTIAYKGNKIIVGVESITEQAFNFYKDFDVLDPEKQAGFNEKLGNPRSTFSNGSMGIFNIYSAVFQEFEVEEW